MNMRKKSAQSVNSAGEKCQSYSIETALARFLIKIKSNGFSENLKDLYICSIFQKQ